MFNSPGTLETGFLAMRLIHVHVLLKYVVVVFFQSIFDQLEGEEMRRARTRSNPYETIRGAFFLNRYNQGRLGGYFVIVMPPTLKKQGTSWFRLVRECVCVRSQTRIIFFLELSTLVK